MINHPPEGAWLSSLDAFFVCATVDFKNIHHGTLLSEVNNAVDGRLLLLTSITVDASDATH